MTANILRGSSALRTSCAASSMSAPRAKSVRSTLRTNQLILLEQLDEEHQLARAAETMGLTQSAASRLLRQIEANFDVQVFERQARGLVPTRYGEVLIRHARLALSALRLAQEEVTALRSGLSAKAALGAITDPGTHIVPLAIARVKERYPDTLVHVEINPSRELVGGLLEGRLDLVVARLRDADSAHDLRYEPLAADEPYAVVASATHPLRARSKVGLEDLIEQPWILPPQGSLVREKLAAMFRQEGLPQPGNIVEAASLPVIATLLARSNMVAALPENAVRSYCEAGILTTLLRNLPLGVGGFGLITRRNCELNRVAQLMCAALRELGNLMYPCQEHSY